MNTGDFKQEFCQAYFPDGETYVLRPTKDCPITPPNTYLKLIRTLYGLKKSQSHWYEKAQATLLAIGLKQNKNVPYIFSGSIMPGHPPIYMGLYVDDFIYFSASNVVKTEFERRIKDDQEIIVDFEGERTTFLGMKLHQIADDDSLTIHL